MNKFSVFKLFRSSLLSILVCFTLILSFGIHSMELTHTHPGHSHVDGTVHPGETKTVFSVQEYVHANEQKMLLMILLGILILGSLIRPVFLAVPWKVVLELSILKVSSRYRAQKHRYVVSFVYLLYLFRKGILNPKLY